MPRTDPTMTSLRMSQFYKTKTCPWYFKGRCERGDSCRFAHSDREKRDLPDLSRTSFCPTLLKQGTCQTPHCRFAHNVDQLRATNDMYKTSLCFMFMKSRCEAGSQCRHAHGSHELRAPPPALSSQSGSEASIAPLGNPSHSGKQTHQQPSRLQDVISRQRSARETSVPQGRSGLDCHSSLPLHGRSKADGAGRQRQGHSSRRGTAGRNSAIGLNAVREALGLHQTAAPPRRSSLPDLSREFYDRLHPEDLPERRVVPSHSDNPFLISTSRGRASSIWPGVYADCGLAQGLDSKAIESLIDAEAEIGNGILTETSAGVNDPAGKQSCHHLLPADLGADLEIPGPHQGVPLHQLGQKSGKSANQPATEVHAETGKTVTSRSRRCSPSCPPLSISAGGANSTSYVVELLSSGDPNSEQGQSHAAATGAAVVLSDVMTRGIPHVSSGPSLGKTYLSPQLRSLSTNAWTFQNMPTDLTIRPQGMAIPSFGAADSNPQPQVASLVAEQQPDLLGTRLVPLSRERSMREGLSASRESEGLDGVNPLLLRPSHRSSGTTIISNMAEEGFCASDADDLSWLPLLSDLSDGGTSHGMVHRRLSGLPSTQEMAGCSLLEIPEGLRSGCTTAATTTTTTPTAGLSCTDQPALGGERCTDLALNWISKFSAFNYIGDPESSSTSSRPASISDSVALSQEFLHHSQVNDQTLRFTQGLDALPLEHPQEASTPASPTLPDLLHQIEAQQRNERLRWDEIRSPRGIKEAIGDEQPPSQLMSPVWLEGRAAAAATASPSEFWTRPTDTISRAELPEGFPHWPPLSFQHPLGQPQLI